MLKLASLSLAALLAFASPVAAKSTHAAPPDKPEKVRCIAPTKFPDAIRVEGSDLIKFREIARGLPDQIDLVLLLKSAPVAVAFVKGCAVGYGQLGTRPAAPPDDAKPSDDDGKI